MPRDRLMFKYTGDGSQFLNGVPQRDIMESERDRLSDEQLAALGANAASDHAIYRAYNSAMDEAEPAAKRVARSDAAPMTGSVVVPDPTPADAAPKDGGKK